ncbi:DNA primase [Candidatus Woesearchaeota archaeon]|nr:DNA primase [Candidatus Woesearchaeota archaeon]
MGKISPVTSKYIVHASIEIDGVVDKPDVIGAIFGQTEGLLGSELELRELQRSGRIGRIEVNVDTRSGKSTGVIVIPSSLDKAETSIIAASLEVIQRIGPCNAKIKVQNIEDVRVSKRIFVIERAKELLRTMIDKVMPDSLEIAEEVAHSVRIMEAVEYGTDRLPAGPAINESDDIIVVEGRADVLTLLKNGFKNAIAMNGTSCPQTVIDLSKKKEVTVFVDGDRGGDLIIKELFNIAEVDFVARAPDGKEVEELTKKEIHKAIRSKITSEQAKLELVDTSNAIRKPMMQRRVVNTQQLPRQQNLKQQQAQTKSVLSPTIERKSLGQNEKVKFGELLESLIGTRGAVLLDEKLNILGKVPCTELATTLTSLNGGVFAVVFDGVADKGITDVAEKSHVQYVVAMDAKISPRDTKINLVTAGEL